MRRNLQCTKVVPARHICTPGANYVYDVSRTVALVYSRATVSLCGDLLKAHARGSSPKGLRVRVLPLKIQLVPRSAVDHPAR